jgi:hypothetical protein
MVSVFLTFCRAHELAIGLFAAAMLIPPSMALADAPSVASTQPSPNPLQAAGSAVSNYLDRGAPLLPTGVDEEKTLELAPGTFGVPANVAQKSPSSQPTTAPTATGPATQVTQPEKKGEWLIAPLPNYSPTFGWGVIGRLGYIFPFDPKDKISPPSTVGAFGYYSQNNSWVAGLGTRLFLDEDRYRISGALMHGDLNYDFSGIGTEAGTSGHSVPLGQEMTGGMFETLFKIAPNIYVGPKYVGANMHVSVDAEPNSSVTIPVSEINTTMSGLGLHAQWDTRDSVFYPRKGQLADFDVSFHDPALGDDFAYQVFTISYNQYFSLASNQVLAVRAMGQFENGDVPFYALCKFGRGSDLRGYKIGQFQDKQMFAIQAEYRLEITKRIGAVAFAGVGEVMPSVSAMAFENLLPSGGVGLRYVLAPQNHVAIRLDVAWGREGSQFYLTVGEAF